MPTGGMPRFYQATDKEVQNLRTAKKILYSLGAGLLISGIASYDIGELINTINRLDGNDVSRTANEIIDWCKGYIGAGLTTLFTTFAALPHELRSSKRQNELEVSVQGGSQ